MSGLKEEEGKLEYELDWEFIQGMAERMAMNKGKYPPFNWKKDINVEKLNQALIRHMVEIQKGKESDEQYLGHYFALALNSMMIVYQINKEKK